VPPLLCEPRTTEPISSSVGNAYFIGRDTVTEAKCAGTVSLGVVARNSDVGAKNLATISSDTSCKLSGDHLGRPALFSTRTAVTPVEKSELAPL